jgi:AhpD family alkylhydroperoxidase
MTQRMNAMAVAPKAYQAMYGLETYVRESGLDHMLVHLLKLRVSYMNGCAYCVDMHSKDARAGGETEQRIYSVPLWRETPFYTSRERAAFAWSEAVTALGPHGVSDEAYDAARQEFDEAELVHLTMAIVTINGWNRLAIALGADVGSYQPKVKQAS